MGDKAKKKGGSDSLAQVTLERDQLLRNEKTYQQRILQLEEEVKSVVEQSQQLSAENTQLRNKMDNKSKGKGGSHNVEALLKEKQELTSMVAKTTGEKQQLEFENDSLHSRLSVMEAQSKQLDSVTTENRKLKKKQGDMEKQIVELEKEKQALQMKGKGVDSKQTKDNAWEKTMVTLRKENQELSQRLEQKKSELDEVMRAMNMETTEEAKLKRVLQELESAKHQMDNYQIQLKDAKRKIEDSEKEKDSAKSALRLKESELRGLKANCDEKENQMAELIRQVDASKRNVKQLQTDLEDTKHLEKDSSNMKARIQSLKNEIEDSIAANHKMKEQRSQAKLEIERLNRELATTTDSLTESRRLLKKMEAERGSQDKVKGEIMARRKREVELEREFFDMLSKHDLMKQKIDVLEEDKAHFKQKVDMLEEDKERMRKARNGLAELESRNHSLLGENQKLRQLVADRNAEINRSRAERNDMLQRMDNLERHQMDSDIKVQQLKGWVNNVHMNSTAPAVLSQPALQPRPVVALPPVASHSSAYLSGSGTDHYIRRNPRPHQQRQERQQQLNRSWDNLQQVDRVGSRRTTPGSLPIVLDSNVLPNAGQPAPGYSDMYRNKMRLLKERRW